VEVREFQELIERIYLTKDRARGIDGTFRWFAEEVGELARAVRHQDKGALTGEFADVFAWLASLASQSGIDLESAATEKYGQGCPKCQKTPCACAEAQAQAASPKSK
jgi:NTP pyrophosphatase (non-canonical NTP hydrolase)